VYSYQKKRQLGKFFLLSRIAFEQTRRRDLCRKTNPRVSMNEKRLSDDDDFRCRPSLGVAKLTSPRYSFSDERWEGWRAFSPSVPTPRLDTSLRPFSSTASSMAFSLLDSSLRDAPFSEGRARTTLFSVPLKSCPLPPPARPPGVEIYSSCPTLRVATHEVM